MALTNMRLFLLYVPVNSETTTVIIYLCFLHSLMTTFSIRTHQVIKQQDPRVQKRSVKTEVNISIHTHAYTCMGKIPY